MDNHDNKLVEGFWSDLLGKAKSTRSYSREYYGEWAADKNPRTGRPYHNQQYKQEQKRIGHIENNLGPVLGDVDVPTFQRRLARNAMAGMGRKEDLALLRSQNVTNYGNPNYGKVRTVHPGSKSRQVLKVEKPDTVSDETKAEASRRADIYRSGSYRSIRGESVEQTSSRILAEVRKNIKGGAMTNEVASSLVAGVEDTIKDKVVESFIQDLVEVDGAMGASRLGPATPPKAVDAAEQIFDRYVNTGTTQIPFKSDKAAEIKRSLDTPALLRKAVGGDTEAQASIERGEKSMRPESKWLDAQHHMSSAELAGKGYVDFTGKR